MAPLASRCSAPHEPDYPTKMFHTLWSDDLHSDSKVYIGNLDLAQMPSTGVLNEEAAEGREKIDIHGTPWLPAKTNSGTSDGHLKYAVVTKPQPRKAKRKHVQIETRKGWRTLELRVRQLREFQLAR